MQPRPSSGTHHGSTTVKKAAKVCSEISTEYFLQWAVKRICMHYCFFLVLTIKKPVIFEIKNCFC